MDAQWNSYLTKERTSLTKPLPSSLQSSWLTTKNHHLLPQGNGMVESTNKTLENILRKTINVNYTDWDDKLPTTLWAYKNSYKTNIKHSPFELVYGLQPLLPLDYLLLTYQVTCGLEYNGLTTVITRMENLCLLEKWREKVQGNIYLIEEQCMVWHDNHRKTKQFQEGQQVLWYHEDVKIRPKKFKLMWKGPYVVRKVLGNNIVMLGNLDDEELYKVNAHKLKHYVTKPFTCNPLPNCNLARIKKKTLGIVVGVIIVCEPTFQPKFPRQLSQGQYPSIQKKNDERISFFQPSGNMNGVTQADMVREKWREDVGIVNRASKILTSPLHLKGGGPNVMRLQKKVELNQLGGSK